MPRFCLLKRGQLLLPPNKKLNCSRSALKTLVSEIALEPHRLMFLSKLLSGRNNLNKPKQELLTDAWTSVQRYYETASDPLKDAIELTPIPTCLQNIVKLIQSEEFDYQRANDNLATGPCLEYLLQTRVLEELVEFAKVDASISPPEDIAGLRY